MTKKQQKREQRRRDKEARRRHRQEAEWKRQHPRRAYSNGQLDLRAQVEAMEAKERVRQSRLAPLGMAAALIAMVAAPSKENLP